MPDLQALLLRVEGASGPDRELDAEIAVAFSGDPGAWVVNPRPHSIFSAVPGWWRTSDDRSHEALPFTASLDAALALVERVLPDHQWLVREHHEGKPFGRGYFANVPTGWPGERQHFDAYGKTASLALLAAMLRALIAQQPDQTPSGYQRGEG